MSDGNSELKQLSSNQRELVLSLVERLGQIRGMKAVVLAGSYARGRAQPDSDIDLGLFYSDAAPFSVESLRELAGSGTNTKRPGVTNVYGWGTAGHGGAGLELE